MESKALALGKQVKAEALNSNVHQMEVTQKNPIYNPCRYVFCDPFFRNNY
jgi:hypothetical protein